MSSVFGDVSRFAVSYGREIVVERWRERERGIGMGRYITASTWAEGLCDFHRIIHGGTAPPIKGKATYPYNIANPPSLTQLYLHNILSYMVICRAAWKMGSQFTALFVDIVIVVNCLYRYVAGKICFPFYHDCSHS